MDRCRYLITFALCAAITCLSGQALAARSLPLELRSGARVHGGQWAPPRAHLDGRVVVLEGLIKLARSDRHVVAGLPAGMRPDQRVVFHTNLDDGPARIDVFPDGRVLWFSGVAKGWLSLDGLAFSLDTGQALALSPGHVPYPNQRPPSLFVDRQLGLLSGVVRLAPNQNRIGTLPGHCRPTARQAFSVAGQTPSEVVVHPDGQIVRAHGTGDWISLAGVNFTCTGPGQPIETPRQRAPAPFHAPHAARVLTDRRLMVLAGGVVDAADKRLAVLPRGVTLPGVRLLHRVVNGRATRLHLADGVLYREGPAQPGARIDLSGLVFMSELSAASPTAQAWTEDLTRRLADVPGTAKIRAALDRAAPRFQGTGPFQTTVQLGGATMTLVLYRPSGLRFPELAVVARRTSIGHLIADLEGTAVDDFVLDRGALLYIPRENARLLTRQSDLPQVIRDAIWDAPGGYRWPAVPLRGGANVLGKLAWESTNAPADLVKLLSAVQLCTRADGCGQTVHVQANFARAKGACPNQTLGWRVRLSWPERWDGMLDGVAFEDSQIEVARERVEVRRGVMDDQRLLRIWSDNVTLGGTRYFAFAQCVTSRCKGQNSFALGAATLSLAQAHAIVRAAGGAPVPDPLGGLSAVVIRHSTAGYQPSDSVDAQTGDPKLDTANGFFVGAGQQLVDDAGTCRQGVHGRFKGVAEVHRLPVGALVVDYQAYDGKQWFEAEGTAQLANLGLAPPLTRGSAVKLRVRRDDRSQDVEVEASVGFEGVGAVEGIPLAVGRAGLSWARAADCASLPFDLRVAAEGDVRDPARWRVTAEPNLRLACYQQLLLNRLEGATTAAVAVSREANYALLALAEFGAEGFALLTQAARAGWTDLRATMEAKAAALGRALSATTQQALSTAEAAAGSGADVIQDSVSAVADAFGLRSGRTRFAPFRLNRPAMNPVPHSAPCEGHRILWSGQTRDNLGRHLVDGAVHAAASSLQAIQVGDGRRCSVPIVLRAHPEAGWSATLDAPVRADAILIWTTPPDGDIADAILATSASVSGRALATHPVDVQRYRLAGGLLNVIRPADGALVRHLHLYRPGNRKPIRIQSVEIVGERVEQ